MTGWKKLLLGVIAAGIVLLLVAISLVKIYVTPERVQELLRTGLEESLHRKVSVGKVDVSLFKGIRLERLSIRLKTGKGELLSADDIDISYDFPALFRGQLLLGKIIFKEPRLRLVRAADGRLNISDLIEGQSDSDDATDSSAGDAGGDPASALPLMVRKFSLKGGTLLFIDRKLNPQSPYLYRMENLDLDVENFSLFHPFYARLKADLNNSPVSAELNYDLVNGLQELKLRGSQLNLIPFLPYLQENLPGNLSQGGLSIEVQVEKQTAGLSIRGQIIVDQTDLNLDLDPPIRWKNIRIAVDQNLFYRQADHILEVKKLQIDLNGARLGYQGKVSFAEPLQLAGEGSLNIPDVRKIADLLPPEIAKSLGSFAAAGRLEVTLQLEGQPVSAAVVRQARLKISDLQGSFGSLRPALNGTLTYAEERLSGQQLKIDVNGQQLFLDLEAAKLLSPRPRLQLALSGETLNLDLLFPQQKEQVRSAAVEHPEQKSSKVAGVKAGNNPPPIPPVSGQAELQFAQILYHGLTLEKVKGRCLLDAGKLTLESLTARLAGGDVAVNGAAEPVKEATPFRGRYRINGINLAPVANALLPEGKGSISGSLTAEGHFNGLAGQQDLLTGLQSYGNFDMQNGEIKGSPLFDGFAKFLVNPQLQVLGFRRLHGNYGLKGKQGTIDAKLESRRVILMPKGSFSLDGPLNLTMETRLSPKLMQKSGIGGKGASLLRDESGWSLLPLKVKGRYSRPRFILDSRGIKKQLKKSVTRELGQQLQKKLGGDGKNEGSKQLQQLLDNTLQKLFGK